MNIPNITAIIPAAGVGSRMNSDRPKQYLFIEHQTVLQHTLNRLFEHPAIQMVCLVLAPDDEYWNNLKLNDSISSKNLPKFKLLFCGGNSRAQTVSNALNALNLNEHDWILVHDAARCCLSYSALDRLIKSMQHIDFKGGILALPIADTVKRANHTQTIQQTISREQLYLAQTPQLFPAYALRTALANINASITDEASAMEAMGYPVQLILGERENIKITYPEDLEFAAHILRRNKEKKMNIRIGQGFDVHQLCEGRDLILGGVTIPYEKGLLGHSDADVLLHAITDALLGAAAMGDIGQHFPDTDPKFSGANSRILLKAAWEKVNAEGWRLGNIDCTIIAERPKLAPYIVAMRNNIAQDLNMPPEHISIKAKTSEKIGALGRKEGIAAFVSCLLMQD